MIAIRAIENLFPQLRTLDQAELAESLQLTLEGSGAHGVKLSNKLTIVEGLIWMLVQEAENCTATSAK